VTSSRELEASPVGELDASPVRELDASGVNWICIASLYCPAMKTAAAADLAAELDRRLAQLWRVLARGQHGQLSRTATSVLATLRDSGPQRVTALAATEAVAQPTMTTLIGRLERDGLVARGSDPEDARAVRVAITADGRARLEARRAARTALLGDRLMGLDDSERAALLAALPLLDKLTEGNAG
jgi:DNA-binding MarR family transcriptional regulator